MQLLEVELLDHKQREREQLASFMQRRVFLETELGKSHERAATLGRCAPDGDLRMCT